MNSAYRVSLLKGQAMLFSYGKSGGQGSVVDTAKVSVEELTRIRETHGEAAEAWKVVAVVESLADFEKKAASAGIKWEKAVTRPGPVGLQVLPAEGRLQMEKPTAATATVSPKAVATNPARRIRVLVVDDSGTMRTLLKKIIETDPDLEVVAMAEKPSQAEVMMRDFKPDVITLDIHMPEEDGVTFLRRYYPQYRIPTIMVTAIGLQEGPQVLDALEIGAVDYIQKPEQADISSLGAILREKLRAAAKSRSVAFKAPKSVKVTAPPMDPDALVCLGASTGGTEAIKTVFLGLPAEIPPILVVQHIPPVFSKAFAHRLNQLCPFEVLEATDGLEVIPGRVIIAPGGFQMEVLQDKQKLAVLLHKDAAPVNRHKPSVDFLFDSVTRIQRTGPKLGVILTGMGADGARGLLALRQNGWKTIAQDESTSVVFGMPKEAIALGAAEAILPLTEVAGQMGAWAPRKISRRSA